MPEIVESGAAPSSVAPGQGVVLAAPEDPIASIPIEERKLVEEWTERVRAAKCHPKVKKPFERIRKDMEIARDGTSKAGWKASKKYIANIILRHLTQRVSRLYAKNPKVVARPRKRLSYTTWDGNPESLQVAAGVLSKAVADASAGLPIDPSDPSLLQAQALMADFQKGWGTKEMIRKVGETLEVLYDYFQSEQTPAFKTQLKGLVRRALVCKVGYVKIGFQRELARTPDWTSALADMTKELQFIEALWARIQDSEDPILDGSHAAGQRIAELKAAIEAKQQEPVQIAREGLVFYFPDTTSIIPDPDTRRLHGFLGGRWIAEEHVMSPAKVQEIYQVDVRKSFRGYDLAKQPAETSGAAWKDNTGKADLACVWEVYDRATGTQFTICDGYPGYLDRPATPSVKIEQFFPYFPLMFNEIESENDLFPPSDVELLEGQQDDYNDLRQGLREHRKAARPKTIGPKGALTEQDKAALGGAEAHTHIEVAALTTGMKAQDLVQAIPYPGVDPNLYEAKPILDDMLLTVGSQEASLGSTSGATATESSIAEAAKSTADGSNIDDLDDFLTALARAGGQILLLEMSAEKVKEIVGPGAVWPTLRREEIAGEIYLEVVAGSSGRPNKAVEVQNFQTLAPIMMQIPNISPMWLAKEAVKRLDDRLDPSEAVVQGMASIMAQNQISGSPGAGAGGAGAPPAASAGAVQDPSANPAVQGNEGADTAPRADKPQAGSKAPMGANNLRAVG